jgi:hypothetical protein
VYQVILHCIQGVDCALTGYPEMKPVWFQISVGKAAFHIFMRMKSMKHDRDGMVPGMPEPPVDGDVGSALTALEEAFRRLEAASSVKRHFIYGNLSPQEMLQIQLLHFYDHVEGFSWKKAA